jgi:hypothetical protein
VLSRSSQWSYLLSRSGHNLADLRTGYRQLIRHLEREKDDYWVYEQEANDKDDSEYEYTKDTEKVYVSKLTDKDAMYVSAIQELEARIKTLEG